MTHSQTEICLAPLRGLTDVIFRTTYAAFFSGIDWAVTPFLTTTQGPRIRPGHVSEVLPEKNSGMPVVPQIIANSPDEFIVLARALFDLGYDSVNWNLGCPFARVAKKKRGSGLLPHPERIDAFLNKAVSALGANTISIKMRLGRHERTEIFELLPLLDQYPLNALIIHPRTGVQMYSGHPDLDSFEACLTSSRHRIIYNGDIVSQDDASRLSKRFPSVDCWMIGRGVLMDPFLPSRLKAFDTADDPVNRFRGFHDALCEAYHDRLSGPAHLLNKMKGLWLYFSVNFENGSTILKQVHKSKNREQYLSAVNTFFDDAIYRLTP